MELIDKIFLVVFARYRRKVGESNLESAWRSASNKVSGYVAIPIVAVFLILIMATFSLKRIGAPIDSSTQRAAQFVAGVSAVVIAVILDRHFKRYLLEPPGLASEESESEKRLVFIFRVIAIGMFVLACLTGLLLHETGSRLSQGY